jgi:membrane fusion protein, multidrug efflux system
VKPVDLGPQSGERVAVRSGLSPGDRVVIDGADKLRNGAKVVVRDSPTGGPAGTAPAKDAAPSAAAPGAKPAAATSPGSSSPTGSVTPPSGGADGAAGQGGSRRRNAP